MNDSARRPPKRPSKRQPERTRGEIGAAKLVATASGTRAEIIAANLPPGKEDLEARFAAIFAEIYNRELPLGVEAKLTIVRQLDTTDLDFAIDCSKADYLELAELTPIGTEFGRHALKTGEVAPYDFATWIYHKIIRHKAARYGAALSSRTILLLYFTHWQFLPSTQVIGCLQAYCQTRPVDFAGVFLMQTDGNTLSILDVIHPFNGPRPPPHAYRNERAYFNLPPGTGALPSVSSDP